MKPFNTPILFLIFNRPDETKQVFQEIRRIKPNYLFVAADGPRENRPDDREKCKQTKEIVGQIDWPCEVNTLFREKNLGCKIAVSSAIDWFFENIEEGIILEDDCLPDTSFFPFCAEMLERYRNNEKIMMVGGTNFAEIWDVDSSYFFSKYARLWGWATWRRSWKKYDVSIKSWADQKNKKIVKRAIANRRYWKEKEWVYEHIYQNKKDTWDYQWEYTMLLYGGLAIVPRVNLIQNIGFGRNATHTFKEDKSIILDRKSMNFSLVHTSSIVADEAYDSRFIPKISFLERLGRKIFK